ncbi:teichoic acid transporter [Rhodospirillum rubrum]|uniref:lipopolysaccharide biosynthesis protein n=1 Tax=Rhodospirillum rubrum TaxID=1085 RepID=UPI00190426FA|nr:oligosaccharide flippase family protein [Rhodospirillum rubrum]MBK1665724.1 teichoic acid transporter [Rhodospirillum rubrum]MBK1677182.1 teichoic acid transporter [Rhodospirillum rubrum]
MTGGAAKGRTLVVGAALAMVAFVVEVVSAFFLMPFLIHALGPERYGLWALIGTIIAQFSLLDFGLSATAQRYMAGALAQEDRARAGEIFSAAALLFLIAGGVALALSLILAAVAPLVMAPGPGRDEFALALAIMGVMVGLSLPLNVVRGTVMARMSFAWLSVIEIGRALLRVGAVVLVIDQGRGLAALAAITLAITVLEAVALRLLLARVLPWLSVRLGAVRRATLIELFHFSKHVFVVKIGDMARYRMDNFIIAPVLGLSAVTHYSAASRLADTFISLIDRVFTLCGPVFSGYAALDDRENMREKFLLFTRFATLATACAAGGVLSAGWIFIPLWLGAEFIDSYHAMAALTIGLTALLIQAPTREVLSALYKHPFDAWTNLAEAVANLAISLLLVRDFGILGVALGTAIPMVVVKMGLLPVYACRRIGLGVAVYYRLVAGALAVVALCHLPIVAVMLTIPHSFPALFTAALVCYGLLGVVLFRFALPREVRALLLASLRPARLAAV